MNYDNWKLATPPRYEEDNQCEICREYTKDELNTVRIPFRNIIEKVEMCDECLKIHNENND